MAAPGLAAVAAAMCALSLSACATPPPKGLAPPAAIETETGGQAGAMIHRPSGGRLVALRVTVDNPSPGLLDDQGAGVLTLRREGDPQPIRLVFINDALGIYALKAGAYRVEAVAGYDCGDIDLVLAPRDTPLALGGLDLELYDETAASLAGSLPTLEDIDRIAGLVDTDAAAIDAKPLERRGGISCTRNSRAVSRPDIDPTIRKLTPVEIAGTVVLIGLLGAATGGAAAAGSIVFLSGSAGGLLLLGL